MRGARSPVATFCAVEVRANINIATIIEKNLIFGCGKIFTTCEDNQFLRKVQAIK
jgi:hypothetical protein